MHALIGRAPHFPPHLVPWMPNDAVKIAGKSSAAPKPKDGVTINQPLMAGVIDEHDQGFLEQSQFHSVIVTCLTSGFISKARQAAPANARIMASFGLGRRICLFVETAMPS
jgi:hypothetical protein